jgi:putative inorganic carbon (hco3(-)) transporter
MFGNHWTSKYLPESVREPSEKTAFYALAGCVSLVLVSIAASQILLAGVIAGFVWTLKKRKAGFVAPGLRALVPLLIFMAWTLIAVFASSRIMEGLEITKKFYLFLLIPMVPPIISGKDRLKWIYQAIFLIAVVSSLRGVMQFASDPHRDLLHRISGFMSQWMTFSGLLMLALLLLTAYAFAEGFLKHKWVIPVAACIVFALLLSETRNAWLGAIAGITILILLWKPRAFVFLVVVVLACYLLSPAIRERARSGADPNDPNTRNRIELFQTAIRLIQAHPWLGVGPKNVKYEAPRYRGAGSEEWPDWMYQHMHNNFLQIAAETGIPGLFIWLWFLGKLGWDAFSIYRRMRNPSFSQDEGIRKEALMASSAAIAAWVALIVAGIFEYNFGDSEVLTLFLFIMSAPYAFATPVSRPSLPAEADGRA